MGIGLWDVGVMEPETCFESFSLLRLLLKYNESVWPKEQTGHTLFCVHAPQGLFTLRPRRHTQNSILSFESQHNDAAFGIINLDFSYYSP
jgi:hypothetical protein